MSKCFDMLSMALCLIILVGAVGCRTRAAAPSNPAAPTNIINIIEPPEGETITWVLLSDEVVVVTPESEQPLPDVKNKKPSARKKPKTNFVSDIEEAHKERKRTAKYGGKSPYNSVSEGLRWLATNQNKDGSWNKNPGDAIRDNSQKVAVTALALLAFFSEGYCERSSRYGANVKKAIDWLMDDIDESTGRFQSACGMHEQALGTWALNEAYGMNVKRVKDKAIKATRFVIAKQNIQGGWSFAMDGKKYFRGNWQHAPEKNPVEHDPAPAQSLSVEQKIELALKGKCPDENFYKSGNTFVTCLQTKALKLAKEVKLGINSEIDSALSKTCKWIKYVSADDGRVGCTGPNDTSDSLLAAGAMIRMYTDFKRNDFRLVKTIEQLLHHLPGEKSAAQNGINMFSCYFGTEVCFNWRGQIWKDWQNAMHSCVIPTQCKKGRLNGSWNPKGEWSQAWGRTGQTAWSLLCLETYRAYDNIIE